MAQSNELKMFLNEVPQKIRGEKIRKIACNLTYMRTIYSHKTNH